MAKDRIPQAILESLLEQIRASGDIDLLRSTLEWTINQLIDADCTTEIGAAPYQRTEERTNYRNGTRERPLDTRVGTIDLQIPKLRTGTYYPDWLLERWKPAEQALISTVVEAYVTGTSTRKIDRLVTQLGLEGMDKSTVSRLNKGLDARVTSFRNRQLEGTYPYIWLDATFPKVREDGQVQSTALVIAMGVREDGHREILGVDLGACETEDFWIEFLRDLVSRGLNGVQLVISDAHQGLKNAISAVLSDARWQRCRVHFMRNILSHVPKSAQDRVADAVRTIFEQPSRKHAEEQLIRVARDIEKISSKAAILLEEAMHDLLAHMDYPRSHWRRLRSTNPLERLNREIKRRFNVVGIFPNRDAVIRLGGSLLLQQHEEWIAGQRYFSEISMKELARYIKKSELGTSKPLEGEQSA